ncbi:MAG: alpha/beta hydrolase [Pseudomonadota bacterium]
MPVQRHTKRIIPVSFFSQGLRISGYLHLPKEKKPPVVIGSHGLFSSGNSPKQIALANKCSDIGLAYLRFDHRGCGKSEGDFQEVTSLAGRLTDLSEALKTIREHPETGDKAAIFGSSMGGTTGLTLASDHEIQAIVTVAAPLRSDPILRAGKKTGDLRGLPLSFYEKQLRFDISNNLSGISNILIFHGDADETVPVADAHELHAKASHPKKLIIQEGGDHSMSSLFHQIHFMKATTEWFRQRLAG